MCEEGFKPCRICCLSWEARPYGITLFSWHGCIFIATYAPVSISSRKYCVLLLDSLAGYCRLYVELIWMLCVSMAPPSQPSCGPTRWMLCTIDSSMYMQSISILKQMRFCAHRWECCGAARLLPGQTSHSSRWTKWQETLVCETDCLLS